LFGGSKGGKWKIKSLHVVFVIIKMFQKVLANVWGKYGKLENATSSKK
jgi:hypothetical protein